MGQSGKTKQCTPEKRRRKRKIRSKLAIPVVVAVGLAVSLVTGASAWRDGRREAALQTDRATATARVLASISAEAAAAGDRSRGFQALRAIGQMPGVVYGRIELADGSLLTETGSGVRLTRDVSTRSGGGSLMAQLMSSTSEVAAPIQFQGRRVGQVVLLARTEGVLSRFVASLILSLIAGVAAIVGGLIAAWPLQRAVTRPVEALTRSMGEVRSDHDYGRTVDIRSDDEVGELVDGFNAMLAEIRARDERIAAQMQGLEQEVADRTADYREAAAAAEAANRAKSDFLATMSHEIRTPMNGVMVMAEMLAAGELPARQRRFAEVIAKSGASLLSIINDILDFSKIEAGKLELEQVPTDVLEIAEDVASLFWERASSKGLDLAVYVGPDTPRKIAADPTRLRQVIGNLVNNAIKFTEKGGVLVEIEMRTPTSLMISVRDTGVGIPRDKLKDVFGAFTQADQTTTRKFGGTGLGLAICKRLVEAMGGRFHLSSEVGRGSNFAFLMPVETLEGPAPWPRAASAGAAVVAHGGVATKRALGRYLAQAGFSVADDADQPALIVGAAAELGTGTPKAPTVCIADYGDTRPQSLLDAGKAQALLVQPFRRDELVDLLQLMADGRPLTEAGSRAAAASKADALPAFPGAHILVADDSAVNREVAMEALFRLRVKVTAVADGRQAVDRAAAEAFDLILMDGSMPELDGYQAAEAIRTAEEGSGRRTPIVALTAHVVGDAADAWRKAGMDGVLHKPFTLAAMAETLARFIAPAEAAELVAVEQGPPPAAAPAPLVALESRWLDPEVTTQLASMASSGKADFVDRVHKLYRDNAPPALEQLLAAVSAKDAAATASAAHALKSMSLNLGAREVARLAAETEAGGRDGRLPSPAACAELAEALRQTLAALAAQRAGVAAPAPSVVKAPVLSDDERQMLAELAEAPAKGGLRLVYQPQYDRDGVGIVGAEALLRWRRANGDEVSPALFIPLAEANGLIKPLTDWVLSQALADFAGVPLPVAFNTSALEFCDDDLLQRLRRQLEGADPAGPFIEVEVTETAILNDEQKVRRNMDEVHALGLKLALDDFGAGYSSLSHLLRYPFDKLKIDREFISRCAADVQSAAVVHAVVSIGRALGMRVVAEGVETEEQRRFLKVAGVHAMQGYLFGKPMSAADLRAALAQPVRAAG